MFGFSTPPGAPRAPARKARPARPRGARLRWGSSPARALALSLLTGVLACGDNVLLGNWQLRSLDDAGVDLSDQADAAPNRRGAAAQSARAKQKLKNELKENRESHSSDDEKKGH